MKTPFSFFVGGGGGNQYSLDWSLCKVGCCPGFQLGTSVHCGKIQGLWTHSSFRGLSYCLVFSVFMKCCILLFALGCPLNVLENEQHCHGK